MNIIRDISLVVPAEVRAQEVEDAIENAGGEILWETDLSDIVPLEDVELPAQSMAFRLVFQVKDRALSDEEVNAAMAEIRKVIEARGWEVR